MTNFPRPEGMSYEMYKAYQKHMQQTLKGRLRQRDSGPGVQRPQQSDAPLVRISPLALAIHEVMHGYYPNT